MGYGAVVPNGYGVSYNLQPSNIIFCVASFFTEHTTDSRQDTAVLDHSVELQLTDFLDDFREFCKAIRQSLAETRELFA